MFAVLNAARKALVALLALTALLWLAACQIQMPTARGGGGPRIDTSRPVPVALLVPGGSGQAGDQALALALENAARMAMADLDGVTIDLRVYNTAANRDQAAQMAVKAVQDGAKIILGPVYSHTANAAGLAVAGRGVNVLAFSNNPDIAGGNLFILGNTFRNAADRLVRYANAQGRGNIMIAHGNDAQEVVGRDAIRTAISSNQATLAGVASFDLSQNGIINAIRPMSEQIQESGATSVFFTSHNFDALALLSGLLPENGIDPAQVQFIGLARWDTDPRTKELRGLQNGWFALPDPDLAALFAARYEDRYATPPHPIAGLAYDGIAAIGALVKSGNAEALTAAALTQGSGFVGVNGVFRLLPNGTNERALAVARLENNLVVMIDPAPRSFAGAGF